MTSLKLGMTIKNFIRNLNDNFSELSNKLTYKPISYKVLYNGSAEIPSNSSGSMTLITLNDDITNFDGVMIQRETTSAWQSIQSISTGDVFKVMNTESDFAYTEGCNLYMCNVQVVTGTQLKLTDNVYSGVKTNGTARYMNTFSDRPITKIIGIKLN